MFRNRYIEKRERERDGKDDNMNNSKCEGKSEKDDDCGIKVLKLQERKDSHLERKYVHMRVRVRVSAYARVKCKEHRL